MILTVKTDQPQAELALFANKDQVDQVTWYGHKQLSDTLLYRIRDLLENNHKTLEELTGVVVFQGPGSFTGLRIGITVANTLAYGLQIPVIGEKSQTWQKKGVQRLLTGDNDRIVKPLYGGEANITQPRK